MKIVYNDRIARQFALASILWGALGMSVGLLLGLQLLLWEANLAPFLTFGRLRPVHVHAVVFAFAGNLIFAGVYYSSQRLLRVRLPSAKLGALHFWGWQAVVAAALVTIPLGYSQGKEYAELEWPLDVAMLLLWVVFAIQLFWMIGRRNQQRLHVSIWFYLATLVAFTSLHALNGLAVPAGPLKSYSIFGGAQDALVQWWYGEGGVTFFLTAPVLGLLYYFLPRAAGRPVHSYRLAVLHFWSLVFLYAWIGPIHLMNTALPAWAQTLGAAFALVLWAASWAGVANALLTLRGAFSRLRRDPVLKFFLGAILVYALVTVEGPLLALGSVSSLARYTDWPIGHAHAAGLGWIGYMAAAISYWMVPGLYGARLRSPAAAHAHFYLATVGLLVYASSMWTAGATQGLMLRAREPDGGLTYTFVQTLAALDVPYWGRLAGGATYLAGFLLMGWNLAATIRAGRATDGETDIEPEPAAPAEGAGLGRLLLGQPVLITASVFGLLLVAAAVNALAALAFLLLAASVAAGGIAAAALSRGRGRPTWHALLERRALAFGLLVALAALAGGAAELLPMLGAKRAGQEQKPAPYSPLELEGRDVYLAEGCSSCHSQMIRPFLWEVARYGEVSSASDSVHDHPALWGSRRVGPDLARVGGQYPHFWHYQHLIDPRSMKTGSTMPSYAHLAGETVDFDRTAAKMRALRAAGVPYRDREIRAARATALAQARAIAGELREGGEVGLSPESELVALIAYLQRLGQIESPAGDGEGER